MRNRRSARWALALIAALGLGACGDGYEPVDESHTGTLSDGAGAHGGRTCDSYEITVGQGWTVRADMVSEWDNYLFLAKGDTDVAYDDDGGSGTNASLSHTLAEEGRHVVYACAYGSGRGSYTLHIVTARPN